MPLLKTLLRLLRYNQVYAISSRELTGIKFLPTGHNDKVEFWKAHKDKGIKIAQWRYKHIIWLDYG